jgi:hypothetical protein
MRRYVRHVGIGIVALGLWSSPGWAQSPDLPLALVGERAALQDAVCAQNWGLAMEVSDRLLALNALPANYQAEMTAFRDRLVQYQEADITFPTIPGCDNVSDAGEELQGAGDAFAERVADLAGTMTSAVTQKIVREMGGNNLLMARGLCSLLEEGEIENPFGLMIATVEKNFFGLPVLDLDELDQFREGDREQQRAMVEYLSFMSLVGVTQFCPTNVPVAEALFGVDIPDLPEATTPDAEETTGTNR